MKKITTRMSMEAHTTYVERRTLDRERTTERAQARANKVTARARFGGQA